MFILREDSSVFATPEIKKKFKDKIRFEAILQTAGDVNRNGRIYDKHTLQESIDKIADRIKGREFLGELDHPISSDPSRQCTISLKEVSHAILETGWDGNKLVATMESLRTPNGEILKNLTEDGIVIGFSYRGMGDLKQIREDSGRPIYKVVGPLMSICWDCVSHPSHKQAKITKLNEGVITDIYKSIDPTKILSESSDCITCVDGKCYVPNTWDRLVEQRIKNLRNRFTL